MAFLWNITAILSMKNITLGIDFNYKMKTRSFVEIDIIFLQRIFRLNTIRHYQRMTNEYKILLYQFLITQTNSEGIQKLTLNNDMLTHLMVS